jgi:hypothetical protein
MTKFYPIYKPGQPPGDPAACIYCSFPLGLRLAQATPYELRLAVIGDDAGPIVRSVRRDGRLMVNLADCLDFTPPVGDGGRP